MSNVPSQVEEAEGMRLRWIGCIKGKCSPTGVLEREE